MTRSSTRFPGRRRRVPRWVVVLIAVIVSLVVLSPVALVVGFFYAWGEVHADMRLPSQDVTLTSCRRDAVTGGPVARIRVASQAKRRGSFTVHLRFRDPVGKDGGEGRSEPAGRSTVVFEDVAVGAVLTRDVAGSVPVRGGPRCTITEVAFLSAPAARASASATP
ncbi:hypothetical protein AB0D35_25600 [Streptomyces sp. NPDC048301]|uniref:hypothetical protein n=1 Tax=Streptomyces sp. NPDC048301 TaxID=3155631 RepID=UPI003442BC18